MPRVIDSTVIGATRIVEGSGLRVVKTQHREGPGPGGRVVAQVPKPGLRVPPRSGVTLTVSVPMTAVVPALAGRTTTAATPPLVVPNLVGMRADSAEALLAHSRLRGARVDTVATSTLGGSVLRQDPPAGATVGPGTLVLLYVERGRLIALLLLAGGIATGGALSKLWKLVRHRPEPKPKPAPSHPGLMPEVWLEPHVAEGTHSVADQGQPVIHHELQLVPHAGAQHVEADEPLALEHV